MAAKSFQLDHESGNEESSICLHEDEYEAEETLSFCDLPLYSSDSAQSDVFSKEDGQSSSSCDNDDGNGDDLFDFSSGELTASILANAEKKSIIFCGKIISYKDSSQKDLNFQGGPKLQRKTENYSTFPYSMKKTKPYSVGNASLMRSNTKSRWFLFLFGMPRLPAEMELVDIRGRQSRKAMAAKMFPVAEQGDVGKNKGGRWGRILRFLAFGRRIKQANDVVKGSPVGVKGRVTPRD